MRRICLVFLVLALAGCSTPPVTKSAVPPPSPPSMPLAAYIPLKPDVYMVFKGAGAGIALSDGVAVTAFANAGAVDPKHVVGKSETYGLLFFPAEPDVVELPTAEAFAGEKITAYGQGAGSALRMLDGTVSVPECRPAAGMPAAGMDVTIAGCDGRTAFMFEGEAGAGFVGGPVLDAKGRLVGMVAAVAQAGDRHLIYAYRMSLIRDELDRIVSALPADED